MSLEYTQFNHFQWSVNTYMPGTALKVRDIAVDKAEKNSCPYGAYPSIRGEEET